MTTTRERRRSPPGRDAGGSQPARKRIIYPSDDGKPLAENGENAYEMNLIFSRMLESYQHDGGFYVGMNSFVYYEEGNPKAAVAPDIFVAKGVPLHPPRSSYFVWREGVAPCFVIEVTSRATRRKDQIEKPAIYQRMGVREYILYDPAGHYLKPALQGWRLSPETREPMVPEEDGALLCPEVGLRLRLVDGKLRLYDAATDEMLLSGHERFQLVQALFSAEQQARREAEARAESEARLRQELEQRLAERPDPANPQDDQPG